MSRSEHLELRLHHVESNAFKKNEHISNKCKRDPSPGSWGGIAWHALAIQTSLDRAQYISCSVHQHYCSDPVGHSCQNSMPSLSIAPRPQLGRAVLSTDVNLLMFSRSCIVLYILHWFPHWTEKTTALETFEQKTYYFRVPQFNLTVKHEGLRLCFINIEQGSESNFAILKNNPELWARGHQKCKKHVWQAGTLQSLATCNPQQDAKWGGGGPVQPLQQPHTRDFLQSSAFCPKGQRDRHVILLILWEWVHLQYLR